jgi:threonine dehydrogenase-like Zn-dependent dehydrogenase
MTLAEPLSCVLHAKQWASLEGSDRVLVIGAGSIGLCMAFALSQQPPLPEFDITDQISSRLELVDEALGAQGHARPEPEGEYDVVFDVSGTESGLRKACDHLRSGGRLCSMSHPNADPISPFLVGTILRRDVTFTVSYLNGEWANMQMAAEMLDRHWTEQWDQAIEVLPLSRLQKAYEDRHASRWCKTVIDVASGA